MAEWADENRVLPRGSAEPGPWRTSRTPYLKPIMDAVLNPRYRRIVLVAGSQLGKTELLLNIIGYRMDVDPAPVLFISASQRLAESVSTGRVMPMIKSTPALLDKLDTSRSKHKIGEKFISGQRLGFGWAGSAIELSSHPAHTVLLDERDRMASDIDSEGDPVALAAARTATYADGKVIVVSTPTLQGASPIWTLYESGTMARWSWECPDCLTYFAPEFSLLKWDIKATPQQAKRSAKLVCPHCGTLIADSHRSRMNGAGRYDTTGDQESDTASFWISGLCSPWRSFGQAAAEWIEAARSGEPGTAQACKNTTFGELFLLEGDRPSTAELQKLKGTYSQDDLPEAARILTCGVDMQADRLVYAVRAWGTRSTSWLIRYGELWGPTDEAEVWELLADLLDTEWGDTGKRIRIRRMLVDSGYKPDMAYEFARRHPGRAYPTKGHDTLSKPVAMAKQELNPRDGKAKRRGIQLLHVDASYFKSWLHGRIKFPIAEAGAWHLPQDTSEDYIEQILSESRVAKKSGAVVWVRNRKANHFLDCEVLNAAAAYLLGVHSIKARREPAENAASVGPVDATLPQPSSAQPAPQRQRNPRNFPRGNWTTNWR